MIALISFEKYTNEQLARFTADGSCELFHNNSKKLETTSTGLSVTGAALVDSPSASTGGVEISRYGVYIRSDDSYSKLLLFTTEVIENLMKLFFLILTI